MLTHAAGIAPCAKYRAHQQLNDRQRAFWQIGFAILHVESEGRLPISTWRSKRSLSRNTLGRSANAPRWLRTDNNRRHSI